MNDTLSSQFVANCTDAACKFGFDFSGCKSDKGGCRYGLQNDFQVGSARGDVGPGAPPLALTATLPR